MSVKTVGRWWSNKEIELVEIDGKVYALDGWNGESYLNAWECTGEGYTDASEEQYTITPIYSDEPNENDTYDIISYEVQ